MVPTLVICIVVTNALACLFDPSPGISLQTGLAALLGASNLDLFSQSTDYFAPSTELNILPKPGRWVLKNNFTFFFPCCFGRRRSGAADHQWLKDLAVVFI